MMKITPYTKDSLEAFLKCLASVVCAVRGTDMHSLANTIKQYQNTANSFAEHYGMAKSFNSLMTQFVKKEEDVTEAQVEKLVTALAKKSKKLLADTTISQENLNFLNRCRLVLKKDSDSAYKGIMSTVHQFNDSKLTKFFIPDLDIDVGPAVKKLKNLTQKYLKTSDIFITIDQAKEWKEKSEDSYKEYLQLKRDVNNVYKVELVKMFRTRGKKLLDIEEVKKTLTSKGILFNLPIAYVGQIDEQGKLYTTDGIMLQAMPSGRVTMNPDYKGDSWYCKASPSGKGIQMYYTVEYRKAANQEKYKKVALLGDKIKSIRNGWRKLYDNPTKLDKAISILIELCYETSSRIGSESGNTAGEKTFGMSSIRVSHLKFTDTSVTIKFPGKKGVVQSYKIKKEGKWNTRIYNMLETLSKNKKPQDRVWTIGDKDIMGGLVNKTLKKLGMPEGTGIHKMRTLEASEMFRDILKTCPFKRGQVKQSEAEKWIKENAIKIGERLGHTSNVGQANEKTTAGTALGNYIDLNDQKDFFEGLGLRLPNYLKGKI
jgi:Eukaryotic DNA topoisomerase I, catalytic core